MRLKLVSVMVFMVSVFALSLLPTQTVEARSPLTQFAACSGNSTFFGFPSWDACLPKDSKGNPIIQSLEDVWKIAFPILETLIKAAGYIAVGFIIWGGVQYIRSKGEPAQTTAAKDTILNAIYGLIIVILAVTVVRFIANSF